MSHYLIITMKAWNRKKKSVSKNAHCDSAFILPPSSKQKIYKRLIVNQSLQLEHSVIFIHSTVDYIENEFKEW